MLYVLSVTLKAREIDCHFSYRNPGNLSPVREKMEDLLTAEFLSFREGTDLSLSLITNTFKEVASILCKHVHFFDIINCEL